MPDDGTIGRDLNKVRSDEDLAVWCMLSQAAASRRSPDWRRPAYVKALNVLLDRCAGLPTLEEINEWLMPTGWQVESVAGYVSTADYHHMLNRRTFPVTHTIRTLRDLEHSAAPDFAHDVLGHLPMLFEADYRDLMLEWARRGADCIAGPSDVAASEALADLIAARGSLALDESEIFACTHRLDHMHARATKDRTRRFCFDTFFTWAFEYGIMADNEGKPALIGGAILSSPVELSRLMSGDVQIRDFAIGAVGHPVDYTICQPLIFSSSGYTELYSVLALI